MPAVEEDFPDMEPGFYTSMVKHVTCDDDDDDDDVTCLLRDCAYDGCWLMLKCEEGLPSKLTSAIRHVVKEGLADYEKGAERSDGLVRTTSFHCSSNFRLWIVVASYDRLARLPADMLAEATVTSLRPSDDRAFVDTCKRGYEFLTRAHHHHAVAVSTRRPHPQAVSGVPTSEKMMADGMRHVQVFLPLLRAALAQV